MTPASRSPAAVLLATAAQVADDARLLEEVAQALRAENAELRRDRDDLLALLTTVSQRLPGASTTAVEDTRLGRLTLDRATRRALAGGHPIPLSPREFELLAHLVDRRGRAVSKETIRRAIWPTAADNDLRTVRVHVSSLRAKLEVFVGLRVRITTLHGVGYRLDLADDPG